MTLTQTVEALVELLLADPTAEPSHLESALVARGTEAADAELITRLLPLAAGRWILRNDPVQFPATYVLEDAATAVHSERSLVDSPIFDACRGVVARLPPGEVITLGCGSPEVLAIERFRKARRLQGGVALEAPMYRVHHAFER